MKVDYLIVGSGLTGAVIARSLADAGREVLVVERRLHLGGNVHDELHASGIRVHRYGPHYFRSSSERIVAFVRRFASFEPFEARVLCQVGDQLEPWPLSREAIRRWAGDDGAPLFEGEPTHLEDAALARMPRTVYESFVKEYNEKQWGLPVTQLSADLVARFPLREAGDFRFTRHRFQGLPVGGYAAFMSELLRGIPVRCGHDLLTRRGEIDHRRKLVFTGPIDEFFGFDLGRLAYRGQRREHRHLPGVDRVLPCAQVNNPLHAGGPHVRTIEWKHMMTVADRKAVRGTVLTTETPWSPHNPDGYEYPVPDRENAALYGAYRDRAATRSDLLLCGRLGEYRYLDMDQAIGRALVHAEALLDDEGTGPVRIAG